MMLIHDMIAWPEIITENLWPFAIQYSIDIHNTPPSSGLPSLEIFSGTKDSDHLKNFHTFDCPIYVLEPTLHQNHKILRWKPHYRVGIFSGLSPQHASSVTLALSTKLGLISPQFHLVFDGNFTTTSSLRTNQVPTNWPQLFNKSSTFYVDSDFSQKKSTIPHLFTLHHFRGSVLLHQPMMIQHFRESILFHQTMILQTHLSIRVSTIQLTIILQQTILPPLKRCLPHQPIILPLIWDGIHTINTTHDIHPFISPTCYQSPLFLSKPIHVKRCFTSWRTTEWSRPQSLWTGYETRNLVSVLHQYRWNCF